MRLVFSFDGLWTFVVCFALGMMTMAGAPLPWWVQILLAGVLAFVMAHVYVGHMRSRDREDNQG